MPEGAAGVRGVAVIGHELRALPGVEFEAHRQKTCALVIVRRSGVGGPVRAFVDFGFAR